jgi:surfactin family lipopeptide synthetase A
MMAALRRELNLEVPIAEVYRHNTIESLLEHIESNQQEMDQQQTAGKEQEALVRQELQELKERILATIAEPDNIEDVYPMSDIEKGMVFESLVSEGQGVYHDQMVHQRVFFDFDIERFRYALQLVVEKHSILRTSFHLEEFETQVQMVHKKIDVAVEYQDLSHVTRGQQEQAVRRYLSSEMEHPFEVTAAPLWRMAAFNFGHDEIVFIFQCHHAIIDGWSETSFMTELNNLYLQLGEDATYRPKLLQSDYKDFIIEHELSKRDEGIKAFWKQELVGNVRLDLFIPDSDLQNYSDVLEEGQLKRLEKTARQLNTTIKVVSLSAYLYMLKVMSSANDIIAGLVTNMRPNCEDSDQILGCFLNTIPLRMDINGSERCADLVMKVHEKLIELKDKERLSMLEISLLHNTGMESGNPFFDVIFNYVDFHVFNSIKEDETINKKELPSINVNSQVQGNTYFDFTIDTTGGFYSVGISLTRKLKSDFTAEKLSTLYFRILDHIINSTEEALNKVKYISSAEEQQLLSVFNDTAVAYPHKKTIITLFEEQVARTPEKTALAFEDKTFTYRELNERSNQLGYYLQERYNIQPEDLIGIKLTRNEWMIVSMLAVLKSGAAYLPIDPEYPQDRIEYMLSDSGCKMLIDESELDRYKKEEGYPKQNLDPGNESSDLAYIIYTSGSTGLPKGVMIEHRNVYAFVKWCQDEFQCSGFDVVFGTTSICFDLSVFEIFYSLCSGKELRLLSNALSIPEYLQTSKNVLLNIVPTIMGALLNQDADLSVVKAINMAGEPIPHNYLKRLDTEGIEIRNLYGPSEDTTYSTVYRLRNDDAILIGRPISNTNIYITNEYMGLQPIGLIGEICIGGAGLARGYINKPELTAEKFVANPFKAGERMYKTGDHGRWLDDGTIEFIGRKDSQIKLRGYRIELAEIENCLQSHPEIDAAVVCLKASKEGEKELVAYLVSAQRFNAADLRTYLNISLPVYMLPDHFVQLEQLPLSPNGKIDRKNLPDPDKLSISSGEDYVTPRNEIEEQLVLIWKDVLGKQKIGVTDNFFLSGGHSLKVIQLMSRISKEFGLDLSPRMLFNNPTIEDFANEIENTYWANSELFEVVNADNTDKFSI